MGEDVRLVFHVGLEGGAEHRSQEFEEGLRRDEDRDRVDPWTEGAEIQMRRRSPGIAIAPARRPRAKSMISVMMDQNRARAFRQFALRTTSFPAQGIIRAVRG